MTMNGRVHLKSAAGLSNDRGPLHHCIQYTVAIGLVFGELTARHYEDETAADSRIDALRDRMTVRDNPAFTRDYYDPGKRFIGNAVQVRFSDGSATERVEVPFPIDHRRRRDEGLPVLMEKFRASVQPALQPRDWDRLWNLATDQARLEAVSVDAFMDLLAR